MARYAALLRGINLGRSRRVGMADLRTLLIEQGYGGVATLLQSGNVVLDSDQPAASLGPALEEAITKRFGMPVEVILRSRDEIAQVVALNPLGSVADDGSRYVVAFLASPASEDPLKGVDTGDERYVLSGAEMYLWLPGGQQNSPLMKALAKIKAGPSATVRNWNTVEKLLAMLDRPQV
ncbi:DUF1697 domain-containing protein [Actinoplanes sp. NPDC024001]|uniref:DUF1697 domain-containing protein n=1 Tax=Actinoplanes sp. NPDC024001 TaxID=3154598 RepID=UPI0033F99167